MWIEIILISTKYKTLSLSTEAGIKAKVSKSRALWRHHWPKQQLDTIPFSNFL